jgi:hypothetical protein
MVQNISKEPYWGTSWLPICSTKELSKIIADVRAPTQRNMRNIILYAAAETCWRSSLTERVVKRDSE